jgi:23S rRNA (cytidine1920-2'-O)/16S rRNA (cytidine1409-2'-O)-methyltransferase
VTALGRPTPAADPQASPRATGFDLITGSLCFISLTLVLPALVPLAPTGALLLLVKPQFELQPPTRKAASSRARPPRPRRGPLAACGRGSLQVVAWRDGPTPAATATASSRPAWLKLQKLP